MSEAKLTELQNDQLGELLDKVREFYMQVLELERRRWDDGTQSSMKIELGHESFINEEAVLMAHVSVKHKENL